jgi:hypothetical protein
VRNDGGNDRTEAIAADALPRRTVLALATALLVVRGTGSRRLNGPDGAVDLRSGGERAAEGAN